MVRLVRLDGSEISNFDTIFSLYENSFPQEERRDLCSLFRCIKERENMFFNVIYYNEELAGLVVYWEMSGFYFLEHFAIFEAMRNKKIGQSVLSLLRETLKGELLFEVEPPCDEFSKRRINFYERNGFFVVDKSYFQPSYVQKGVEYPLYIMSSENNQNVSGLQCKIAEIKDMVYVL